MSRKLDTARTAAAKIGIAATHIRRGRCGQKLRSVLGGIEACDQLTSHNVAVAEGIDTEARKQRVGEVGVIEDVEEVSAKFHGDLFGDVSALGQRKVEVGVIGGIEGIAAFAAGATLEPRH